ncbi:MAG: hypothetical protein WCS89_00225 [Candidatus Paceibacterota bacterium]|jgi:hypothetical protein
MARSYLVAFKSGEMRSYRGVEAERVDVSLGGLSEELVIREIALAVAQKIGVPVETVVIKDYIPDYDGNAAGLRRALIRAHMMRT